MVEQLGIRSVLDVGTGTGRVLLRLREAAPSVRVTGIEPSLAMLQVAVDRGVPADTLVAGDALHLPYPSGSVDLVSAYGVMHHVREPAQVIDEMLRVAKRGVFISDVNNFGGGPPAVRWIKWALRGLHVWKWADLIKTAGKGYRVSEGDGISYSYSVFDSFQQLSASCPDLRLLTTGPTGVSPLRSASLVAVLAIR